VALVRSAWRTSWYRAVVVLLTAAAGLVLLMMRRSLIDALPAPYSLLQFSYRLEAYMLLAFAGAVIGVLWLLRRSTPRRGAWAWVLVPVIAWSIVGAIGQLRQRPPSALPEVRAPLAYRSEVITPGTFDYSTNDLPATAFDPRVGVVRFPPDGERGRPSTVTVRAPRGQYLQTNIITMPQLVRLDGARFIAHQEGGQAVVQVTKEATPGTAVLTLRPAHPWPVVLGWIASLAGLGGLALNGVAIAVARRRRSVA
jgi:hypothetical protein